MLACFGARSRWGKKVKKLLRKSIVATLGLLLFLALVGSAFQLNARLTERYSAQEIAPSNGRFVSTNMGELFVSIYGKDTGRPVIMTHGMAAWGGLWAQAAEVLAKNGYYVLAVDLPPFGFSGRRNQDYSRTNQARRISSLAKSLNLNSYLLVGHSYGGGIAMETAMRFPDNISGAVLVCPVMRLAEHGKQLTPGKVPALLSWNWLGELLVAATITNPLLTETLIKRFMHKTEMLRAEDVKILRRPMPRKGNSIQMVKWLRQFLSGDLNAKSRNRSLIAKSKIPVSLIWGKRDSVTPIEQGHDLASLIQPKSFKMLPNIGHMPQIEEKNFASILLDTLNQFD